MRNGIEWIWLLLCKQVPRNLGIMSHWILPLHDVESKTDRQQQAPILDRHLSWHRRCRKAESIMYIEEARNQSSRPQSMSAYGLLHNSWPPWSGVSPTAYMVLLTCSLHKQQEEGNLFFQIGLELCEFQIPASHAFCGLKVRCSEKNILIGSH